MQSLIPLIENRYRILFIAPPAWGKTYRLIKLKAELSKKLFVFVSPLRALCDEFAMKIQNKEYRLWIRKITDWDSLNSKHDWVITTIDMMSGNRILELEKLDAIFILDEFHLYYHWEDFREIMHDRYIDIMLTKSSILFLSATMSEKNILRWQKEMMLGDQSYIGINQGNHQLLYPPKQYLNYTKYGRKYLRRRLLIESPRKGECILIFCQYRQEVDYWVNFFKQKESTHWI